MRRMADIDSKRQQARWRRNKRAQRSRSTQTQRVASAALVEKVLAERDRRAAVRSDAEGLWRDSWFYKQGSWAKAAAFVADVWAATTLREIQFGAGKATPTRIASWLRNNGRDQGYTPQSLRIKVYQARVRIRVFEQPRDWWPIIWDPFDPFEESAE